MWSTDRQGPGYEHRVRSGLFFSSELSVEERLKAMELISGCVFKVFKA